uniref:Flavonoid 3',5'-hydroxylase n=1 Tax=Pohlia nutans TaxID=140635 RepID=W5XJ46_9BRYO|nr:flavonoid 3',5'-hydroxylase [Pohlia nutans]
MRTASMAFSVPSLKTVVDLWAAFKVATLKSDENAGFKVYYLATAVVVILLVRKLLSWRVNLPPGPPSLPLLGHLHLLGADPHRSLGELAQKYGPLMSIRLGAKLCIVCSSPETAKEFLKTQDANFGSRPYTSQGHHLMYGRQDVAFQETNPSWRNLKKIFTMELASGARLEASRHIRSHEVGCLVRAIAEERNVELKSHLTSMISNIISRMVLNKRYVGVTTTSQIETDFPEMVQTHFRLAGLFVPGDFIPAFKWLDLGGFEAQMKKHKLRMDAFVTEIILQHRERRALGPVPELERDYVDVLLDQMEMRHAAFQLSEDNVKALILDAFVAATESMILTSEWAMAELLKNPALMAKAHAELDATIGRDRVLQESDLHKLPYLHAIVKESFRLHPAAPLLLPRESAQASQAFGYNFPAKTRVLVNVWAIGRDPGIWHEPLVFNPDRFLKKDLMHVDVRGQHFELLAFGAGRRVCPAVSMGVLVVQFIVARLLHSFQWKLPDHTKPEDLDMTELFGLTLPRAAPLHCVATPRLSPHLYEL